MKKAKIIKILFIPLGIGLAHTGRVLVVAQELKKRGYEIVFASGRTVSKIIKAEGFEHYLIPEISPKESLDKTRKLKPNFYSLVKIKQFVNAEIKLYKKVKPDVVISDTRLTTKVSTKIAKIPLITINNANVTKYYDYSKARFPIPIFFLNEFIPSTVLYPLKKEWFQKEVLSRVGPPIVEAFLVRQLLKFNIVIQQHDLTPIKSLYDMLMGDLTLIADAPFFRPTKKLPKKVKVVGPLSWQPLIKLPKWSKKIESLNKSKKPIVYITAAGTGDGKIVKKTIKCLSGFPATLVITTGNAMKPKIMQDISRKDLYITNYLPGNWIMQKANAVIFFGGNSTAYQALSNSTPQIIFPLHLDQQDNANQLERLGTGIIIDPNKFDEKTLIEKLSLIIYHKDYKKKSENYRRLLEKWNGPTNAANEIEKFIRSKNKTVKASFIDNIFHLKTLLRS